MIRYNLIRDARVILRADTMQALLNDAKPGDVWLDWHDVLMGDVLMGDVLPLQSPAHGLVAVPRDMALDALTVFIVSASWLIDQGERSKLMDNHSVCAYRGESGRMCAVGCLIPDKRYCPEFEGKGVIAALIDTLPIDDELREDNALLGSLQRIHDYEPSYKWATRLDELADEFGFNLPWLRDAAVPV